MKLKTIEGACYCRRMRDVLVLMEVLVINSLCFCLQAVVTSDVAASTDIQCIPPSWLPPTHYPPHPFHPPTTSSSSLASASLATATITLDDEEEEEVVGKCLSLLSPTTYGNNHWMMMLPNTAVTTNSTSSSSVVNSIVNSLTVQPHPPPPMYRCPECHKVLRTRQGLSMHLDQHRGVYRYRCPVCSKGLASSTTLKEHMASEHTHAPPFVCVACDQAFWRQKHLKKHRLTACKGRTEVVGNKQGNNPNCQENKDSGVSTWELMTVLCLENHNHQCIVLPLLYTVLANNLYWITLLNLDFLTRVWILKTKIDLVCRAIFSFETMWVWAQHYRYIYRHSYISKIHSLHIDRKNEQGIRYSYWFLFYIVELL